MENASIGTHFLPAWTFSPLLFPTHHFLFIPCIVIMKRRATALDRKQMRFIAPHSLSLDISLDCNFNSQPCNYNLIKVAVGERQDCEEMLVVLCTCLCFKLITEQVWKDGLNRLIYNLFRYEQNAVPEGKLNSLCSHYNFEEQQNRWDLRPKVLTHK